MPRTAKQQANIEKLLRDNVGKEAADAILTKIDKMAKEGAKPAAIEKVIAADLQAHIEQQVTSVVIAKIGPIQPIKVQPIQASVKPAIKPIAIGPKVNTGVSVKIGPGPMIAKGARSR